MGFAGQIAEHRFAVSHAVNVDALGIHFVEINFHHAAGFDAGKQGGLFLRHVGGVFRADDVELFADDVGVGGAFFDALGQEPRIGLAGGDGVVQIRMGGLAGVVGQGGGGELGVQGGIVGGQHGRIRRRRAGGGDADAAFEGVMPLDVGGLLFWYEVLFCHNMLWFSLLAARKGGDFGGKSGLAE